MANGDQPALEQFIAHVFAAAYWLLRVGLRGAARQHSASSWWTAAAHTRLGDQAPHALALAYARAVSRTLAVGFWPSALATWLFARVPPRHCSLSHRRAPPQAP